MRTVHSDINLLTPTAKDDLDQYTVITHTIRIITYYANKRRKGARWVDIGTAPLIIFCTFNF